MAGLKYNGGGHLPGVPSRDLTAAEVKKFGREMLKLSGLYSEHTRPSKSKKSSSKKEESEG